MSNDLEQLKQSIGFKMAFRATLGFYAAQFIATILGLLTISIIGLLGYLLVKFVF